MITEPGVYDLPENVYHADPVPGGSLSVSGAKKLLPPSCPARFDYERARPPAPSAAMELGTAAHKLVLGAGQPLAVIDAPDWRGKAAKEAAAHARADGKLPLLFADHERVQAMAAAIRAHPLASALLCRGDVQAEQSLFWRDEDYGVWRRARLDATRPIGRPIVADYKSAASADPGEFSRSCAKYGYHMQHAWYVDAYTACYGEEPAFLFVAQEKEPPYLVSVCELEPEAVALGRRRNRRALEIYRDCAESGVWPGHVPADEIAPLTLPAWA